MPCIKFCDKTAVVGFVFLNRPWLIQPPFWIQIETLNNRPELCETEQRYRVNRQDIIILNRTQTALNIIRKARGNNTEVTSQMEKQLSGVPLKNSDPTQKSEQGGERPILVLGSLTPTPISSKDGGNYLIFPFSSWQLFHAEKRNKSTHRPRCTGQCTVKYKILLTA